MSDDWSIRNPFLIKQTTNSLSKTESGTLTASSTSYPFTQWDLALQVTSGIPALRMNFRNAGGVVQVFTDFTGSLTSGVTATTPTITNVTVPTYVSGSVGTSWTLSAASAVSVSYFVSSTATNSGGTQIGTAQSVASGTLTSSATVSSSLITGYVYATVTPTGGVAVASAVSVLYTTGALPTGGFDVILLFGQSNMAGASGPRDAAIDTTNSRILMWGNKTLVVTTPARALRGNGQPAIYVSNTNAKVLAIDPLIDAEYGPPVGDQYYREQNNRMGPGLTIAKTYLASYVTDSSRGVIIVNAAFSGEALVGGGLTVGGDLYLAAIDRVTQALADNSLNVFKGIFWIQGETDAANSAITQAAYDTALRAMINGLRSSITGGSSVPFVMGSMTPDNTYVPYRDRMEGSQLGVAGATRTFGTGVGTAIMTGSTPLTNCAFVYGPTGNTGNGAVYHYVQANCRTIGAAMVTQGYAAALAQGSAPVSVVGVSSSQTSTGVSLSWNLSATATGYSIQYRIGTGAYSALVNYSSNYASITGLSSSTTYQFSITANNTYGSSTATLYSATTSTAVAAPAAVTGIGSTPTSTGVSLTWNAVATATSYGVQYRIGTGAYSTIASYASNSASITGLSSSTTYEFSITAINGGVSSTATTYSVATTAVVTLVGADVLMTTAMSEFALAIGLRKLFAAYTGPIARIFKDASTYQDFYAGSDGFIDTAAIATFLAGTAYPRILQYDQRTTSGVLLTQATHAYRPFYIAPSGAIKAAVVYDGATYQTLPVAIALGTTNTVYSVLGHQPPYTGDNRGVHLSLYSGPWYTTGYVGASSAIIQYTNTLSVAQSTTEAATLNGTLRLEEWNRSGVTVVLRENKVVNASVFQPTAFTASTGLLNIDTVGGPVGFGSGYAFIGSISEVVCTYTAIASGTSTTFSTALMTAYGIA